MHSIGLEAIMGFSTNYIYGNFYSLLAICVRTKAEPPIFYLPAKPLEADATLVEQRKMQV